MGAACGDAFGAPFEYHPDATRLSLTSMSERRYLTHEDTEVQPGWARIPGLYTDDTQQSLILMMAKSRDLNPADARKFFRSVCKQMFKTAGGGPHGAHRGTGSNFRTAILTAIPMDTAGLGAAMRVAPVATMFRDPQQMLYWLGDITTVTTRNALSLACAHKVALAAWTLANPDRRNLIHNLVYPAAIFDPDVKPPRWRTSLDEAVWDATVDALEASKGGIQSLSAFGAESPWLDKPLDCVTQGFCLTGFAWAVRSAFMAESFPDALLMAAEPGGDTDTICAITGALAAIRFGVAAIPEWMVEGLVLRPTVEGTAGFIKREAEQAAREVALWEALSRVTG